jgi:ribosome recycling factor
MISISRFGTRTPLSQVGSIETDEQRFGRRASSTIRHANLACAIPVACEKDRYVAS